MTVIAPQFARRLSDAIDSSKLSSRKVAELSGVNKGTISEWTRPQDGSPRAVKVESVERVAAVLGTSSEALLDLPTVAQASSTELPIAQPPPVALNRIKELLDELSRLICDELAHEVRR